jgi:energy-coupling factor transporter ATP-binding protein EcfA2
MKGNVMIDESLPQEASVITEVKSRHLQDALLCNMELPLRDIFYPLGYAVEIITNDPSVLEAAHESFGHACFSRISPILQIRIGVSPGNGSGCPPEPIRREYNHLYSLVADVNNQALLDLKSSTSFAWLTQETVENKLYLRYNFIEKIVYLLLGASVVTDLHAACVSKNGKGVLLCGDSGAGKSTLAYACARADWTYTSDDTSYLINESDVPRVIGHSHRARFRPSARALFPELKDRKLTPRLEGKPSIEVPISELPIASATTEAIVSFIIYLNRHASGAGNLIPLPRGTATWRARQELYSAGEIRAKHEEILESLFDTPTFELQYWDLDDAIRALDSLMRST